MFICTSQTYFVPCLCHLGTLSTLSIFSESSHSSGIWLFMAPQYLLCDSLVCVSIPVLLSKQVAASPFSRAYRTSGVHGPVDKSAPKSFAFIRWILDLELEPPRIQCFPMVLVKLSWTKLIPILLAPSVPTISHQQALCSLRASKLVDERWSVSRHFNLSFTIGGQPFLPKCETPVPGRLSYPNLLITSNTMSDVQG